MVHKVYISHNFVIHPRLIRWALTLIYASQRHVIWVKWEKYIMYMYKYVCRNLNFRNTRFILWHVQWCRWLFCLQNKKTLFWKFLTFVSLLTDNLPENSRQDSGVLCCCLGAACHQQGRDVVNSHSIAPHIRADYEVDVFTRSSLSLCHCCDYYFNSWSPAAMMELGGWRGQSRCTPSRNRWILVKSRYEPAICFCANTLKGKIL